MVERSILPRLTDIVEATALIQDEMAGVTLRDFKNDRRQQWVVERGLEIISEASRHLSDELKSKHLAIPWRKVAGMGNVLRHNYEDVAYDVLWHVVHNDLPELERVCGEEFARSCGQNP